MSDTNLPKVAVVILNYNGMKDRYLERFLPSVYQSTYANMDLYVIDNKSTDDSIEYLKKEGFVPHHSHSPYEHRRFLIALPENYWFAGGYNKGLQGIEADYFVLLNSDVKVAANWIEPIIELMEKDAQIAACQPKVKMLAQQDHFEHAGAAGGWIDRWGYPFCRGRIFNHIEEDQGQYDDTQEVFWASGAAMFIRPKLFFALGGFDADYLAHMEEIDLCWRFKRANYKIMVCPQSEVWHVGGGTLSVQSPHKTYLNFRNSLTTVFKNLEGGYAYWVVFLRLWLDGIAGIRFLLRREFGNIWAIVQAHWAFFRTFGKNKRKKKAVQQCIEENAFDGQPHFSATGQLPQSIVFEHFVKGKKTFKDLSIPPASNPSPN